MAVKLGLVNLEDPVFIERKVIEAVEFEKSGVDLVLLKMEKEVFFHQAVSPISLPRKNLSGQLNLLFFTFSILEEQNWSFPVIT